MTHNKKVFKEVLWWNKKQVLESRVFRNAICNFKHAVFYTNSHSIIQLVCKKERKRSIKQTKKHPKRSNLCYILSDVRRTCIYNLLNYIIIYELFIVKWPTSSVSSFFIFYHSNSDFFLFFYFFVCVCVCLLYSMYSFAVMKKPHHV